MNIKISKKGATYSIPEQYEDKSKHSDEKLTNLNSFMEYKRKKESKLREPKSLYNTGDKY